MEGWKESAESADDVDSWAMVTKTLVVPVAFDSCLGRSPGSPYCSCCSGCYWRWGVEEAVHCEVVYMSWSRLGSPHGYEWAIVEEATAVWAASDPSMASISAKSSVWEKVRNWFSSPCSFSSACARAGGAPATDSPLALQVWVSESPIAYPCWSVVSSLSQTISAGRDRKAHSRRGTPGFGGGVLCSQGCEGARKNQGGEPKGRKRKQATHNITWTRRAEGREEGFGWKGRIGWQESFGIHTMAEKPSQG